VTRRADLSDRAIADLCGVDHKTVSNSREKQLGKFPTSETQEPQTRTGKDPQPRPRARGVTKEKSLSENDNSLITPRGAWSNQSKNNFITN
jgi:hypothetical protein